MTKTKTLLTVYYTNTYIFFVNNKKCTLNFLFVSLKIRDDVNTFTVSDKLSATTSKLQKKHRFGKKNISKLTKSYRQYVSTWKRDEFNINFLSQL